MIDINLIIDIILNYDTELRQWSVARLLNTSAKYIVDSKPYNKQCYGRSTFIRTEWCCICEKSNPHATWLRCDEIGRPSYILHCQTWFCRVSAIHSMISQCQDTGRVLLRVPWKKEKSILIPRSDGSESRGYCKINSLVVKNKEYYVETEWSGLNGEAFTKLIKLSYYSNSENPKTMLLS